MVKGTLIAMCLFTVFCGCGKADKLVINNVSGSMKLIGHAGCGELSANNIYIPNSYEAMERALDVYNIDGVETDLQLSADNVLFMFHDMGMETFSNCTGCIAEYSSAVVEQCTFKGGSMTNMLEVPHITRLEKLLQKVATQQTKQVIFMDLHEGAGCADNRREQNIYYKELIQAIRILLDKYNAYEWVYIQSNSRKCLEAASIWAPQARLLIDGNISADDMQYALDKKLFGIACKNDEITDATMQAARSNGLYVQLYGIITKDEIIHAAHMSPDFIMVDNVPLAISVLSEL